MASIASQPVLRPDTGRATRGVVVHHQPLVAVVAAVALGVGADRAWAVPATLLTALVLVLVGCWWLALRFERHRLAGTVLLMAVTGAGGLWHHLCWRWIRDDDLGRFAQSDGGPVCLEAIVVGPLRMTPPAEADPLRTFQPGWRTRISLEVHGLRDGRTMRSASGLADLLVEGRADQVHAGDRVRVFAMLSSPQSQINPGGFDYAGFLRANRTFALLHAAHPECIERIASASVWSWRRWLDAARDAAHRALWSRLDENRYGLAAAVLLGDRALLDSRQNDAFMETGTVHLLAVSGLNVGILAGAGWWLLRRLPIPNSIATALVMTGCLAYMFITGGEPPVVRATILMLGLGLATATGRTSHSLNLLALAGLVVLAINPADLFNVGAQLSFLCVAVMAVITPRWLAPGPPDPLDELVDQARSWPHRLLRKAARASWQTTLLGAAIYLFVSPLIAARFHLVTPIAPLMNAVLWLPVGVSMVAGMATLLFGWIPLVGLLLGAVANGAFWAMQQSVLLARHVPGGHLWVAGPDDWWLAGLYAGLGLLFFVPQWRPPLRWQIGLACLWITIGFAASPAFHRPVGLRATVASVGHGCATIVRLPDGRTLLYDAGTMGDPARAGRTIAEALWYEGQSHLDAVVLSHADVDHYNGLPYLLDRISVGVVYVSDSMFRQPSEALLALRRSIEQHRVPIRALAAGDRLQSRADCQIEVLHPPAGGLRGSDNANSIVITIAWRGQRLLLPGDLDSPGLETVCAEHPQLATALLAPHHGSRRSHPGELAAWCQPRWVVVSGGRQDRWEAPAETGGVTYFHTALSGAIAIEFRNSGPQVLPFQGSLGKAKPGH